MRRLLELSPTSVFGAGLKVKKGLRITSESRLKVFELRLSIKVLLILLFLAFSQPANAQYVIKEADTKYELFDYKEAIGLYEQAYKKKQTLHAAERLASCYSLVQNYKEAEYWYGIAAFLPGSAPLNLFNYARSLQSNAKYIKARDMFMKYGSLDDKVTPEQKNVWILSCDSALMWMNAPRHVAIENLEALNTPKSDWGAVAYGRDVVFASDRMDMPDYLNVTQKENHPFLTFDDGHLPGKKNYGWTGNGYLRLYIQRGNIYYFPAPIKTGYHIGPASFTADGNELYFTLTRIPKENDYDEKGNLRTINVEIYSSKKDSTGNWTPSVAFKYNKINEYSVGDPYISRDGKTLYFVSNMPGGKGGTDIYYCTKKATGEWDNPVNLTEINTNGNERTPSFDSENNFYFSSDGRIGMGGLDIFKSKVVNGNFLDPVNMGYPLNSPQDDFAYNSNNPDSGYFASNRPGGLGSDDIYRAIAKKPQRFAFELEGTAYDKQTKKPIANAVISLTKIGGPPLNVQADSDGTFKFDLETNSNYNLNGKKANFRSESVNLSTVNLTSPTLIKADIYFEKIVLNEEIVLANIYYDFDLFNIRQDAAKELNKLVKILNDNPAIFIELGSHTDSRGSDQYNQWLSEKRANSVVRYLIDRGINQNRILAKGYGKTQLLNRCDDGIKCTEAEQELNRRTEFKIIKQ